MSAFQAGPSGLWVPWVPTLAAPWVVGSGSTNGEYAVVGKMVSYKATITFAGDSVFGGTILTINNLPFARDADAGPLTSGVGRLQQTSSGFIFPAFGAITPNSALVKVLCLNGNQYANVVTATPFAWASGDVVTVSGSYGTV